jgi:hypothetical protein
MRIFRHDRVASEARSRNRPTHRGFGYVIFEGPDFLIDWGLREVDGPKNKASVAAAAELITRYHPRILVLEDVAAKAAAGADECGSWLMVSSGTVASAASRCAR